MKITIHRGSHEIGGSCIEIASKNSKIIIDIGIPLIGKEGLDFNIDEYKSYTGEELVRQKILPPVTGLYKWDKSNKKVDGLLISHAHLDHYGLFSYVKEDITYYIGEGAKKLIETTCIFTGMDGIIHSHFPLESGKAFELGEFKITPYLMDHSAYDAYGFLIESNGKQIIYTGDFRNHGRKYNAYKWFLYNAPKNIDALLIEGTMLGREGELVKKEQELEEEIRQLVNQTNGITLLYLSAQNIDRVVTMYRVAKRFKKLLVIDVYTANVLANLNNSNIPHPSPNYPEIRVFYPKRLCNRMTRYGQQKLLYRFKKYKIRKEEINVNKEKIMMMIRPTMLDDLIDLNIKGAQLIYSMWAGYLKKDSFNKILQWINEQNVKFHYIHTSGHASIDTLKEVIDHLMPKEVIPIHTFDPKKFKDLSNNVKILVDGETYKI